MLRSDVNAKRRLHYAAFLEGAIDSLEHMVFFDHCMILHGAAHGTVYDLDSEKKMKDLSRLYLEYSDYMPNRTIEDKITYSYAALILDPGIEYVEDFIIYDHHDSTPIIHNSKRRKIDVILKNMGLNNIRQTYKTEGLNNIHYTYMRMLSKANKNYRR